MKEEIVHCENIGESKGQILWKTEGIWRVLFVVFNQNWFCERPVDLIVIIFFSVVAVTVFYYYQKFSLVHLFAILSTNFPLKLYTTSLNVYTFAPSNVSAGEYIYTMWG